MDALADLREPTVVSPPAKPAEAKGGAAQAAAPRREPGDDSVTKLQSRSPRPAAALVEIPADAPVPSLRRSPIWTALWAALIVAAGVSAVMVLRWQKAQTEEEEARYDRERRNADELTARLTKGLPDSGAVRVTSTPGEATGWMLLGRTPFESAPLSSTTSHLVRIELDRHRTQELVIDGRQWTGVGDAKHGKISVQLQVAGKEPPLSAIPAEPPPGQSLSAGAVRLSFQSEPRGAAVWLYLGVTGEISYSGIAGREYDLRALKDGFLPGYARVGSDDWRALDARGKPVEGPIDSVPKKPAVDVSIVLTADPAAAAPRKGS
jgi:hypothetical protein